MPDPSREAELQRLLEAALEVPEDQWHLFLENAASAPELAREAEALLRCEEDLGDFLVSPVLPMGDTTDLEEALGEHGTENVGGSRPVLGQRFGAFSILGTLGTGGMGKVFLAQQQEPVRRHVALKVIDRPYVGGQIGRRFEAEREALARLSHPHIAQLYEAGTQDGTPFFAMELVEGTPITTYCDAARLDVRQRLGLLLSVCLGVSHAHQKGILHRDLKPSNILVTESDGRPQRPGQDHRFRHRQGARSAAERADV